MKNYALPSDLKQLLTPEQVKHYGILIFDKKDDLFRLYHKMEEPELRIAEIQLILGSELEFIKIESSDFDQFVAFNYRISVSTKSARLEVTDDVFETITHHAYQISASDIHIEPLEKKTRVRFRIDGALKQFYEIPASEHSLLINKIKIKANLNISERRRNQDGRISHRISGAGQIDIRVSSLPSLYGEKIVMRLLESNQDDTSILNIGLSENQLAIYQRAYQKTNGIILISGPTGSGKTTTLYATLKELNKESLNVLTVEDPIEYTLEGINQVQVKHDIGFDFATALKTFLRQDPDVIMVGEIRDQETAQMAVKASLTGHLVFSTIHTNSALGTINRLKDMGIPDYLIASTLNLSVAQRLVRLLCDHCKVQENHKIELFLNQQNLEKHASANGCEHCHYTGYIGRTALFEMVEINEQVSQMIKNDAISDHNGSDSFSFTSIKQQAIVLLVEERTSYEEIYPLLIE